MEQVVSLSITKQSKNYKSFKRLPGNRLKSAAHIKALRESIRQRPDLLAFKPILVNEKMEIIDGQHRYEICREFEYPINYTVGVGLTLEDAQLINQQQKNWTPLDFAKSWIELGNENYKIYLEAFNKYHYNHEILMRYLSGPTMTTVRFKAGAFTVPDKETAFERLDQLTSMKVFYDRYSVRVFAFGFYNVCSSGFYNHERMVKQLRKYNGQLRDWGKAEGYARNLEDIFNAGQHKFKPRLFGSNVNLTSAFSA